MRVGPKFEVSRVTESDVSLYMAVASDVYNRGRTIERAEYDDPTDEILRYLVRVDGTPAATFRVWPFTVTRGAGTVSQGGVASVAVLPEYRGGGVGSAMMRSSLQVMRDHGFATASLYAFRESYYRKFGYELCGQRWEIKCPQARLPRLDCEMPVRKISATEILELDPCYTAFARTVSGANLRTPEQWNHRLGKNPPMIYAIGDPIEAYCWTSMEGEFWDNLTIGELAWQSRRGYLNLLGFLRTLAINRSSVTWSEPSQGPFLTEFLDSGIEFRLHRPSMARVLSVEAAVAGLMAPKAEPVTFEVIDPVLTENHGMWEIQSDGGNLRAEKTTKAPDFRAKIGEFTQGLFGEPDFERLATHGRIEVLRPSAMATLLTFFPPRPVICTEFF